MTDPHDSRTTAWQIDESEFYELDSVDDQMRFLLRYAVLAPSSRNTQPWAFQIAAGQVRVLADYTRRLPLVDPLDRELLMSVGAAITNFRVAAAHFGFATTVRYELHGSGDDPVAFIDIAETSWPDSTLSALFGAIRKRHTNRETFDGSPLAPHSLSRVHALMDRFPGFLHLVLPDDRLHAAQLIEYAERLQMERAPLRAELAEWIHPDDGRHTDGLPPASFGIPRGLASVASWFVRRFSAASWHGARQRRLAQSAPALLIVSADDDHASLLRAGEILEELLLTITDDGLQYSFLNQAIEAEALRERVQMLACSRAPAQLLLRLGNAAPAARPVSRRPVNSVIRPATRPPSH